MAKSKPKRKVGNHGSGSSKRSVYVNGHKTSVSLDDKRWGKLKRADRSIGEIVSEVDAQRAESGMPLSAALRRYVDALSI